MVLRPIYNSITPALYYLQSYYNGLKSIYNSITTALLSFTILLQRS